MVGISGNSKSAAEFHKKTGKKGSQPMLLDRSHNADHNSNSSVSNIPDDRLVTFSTLGDATPDVLADLLGRLEPVSCSPQALKALLVGKKKILPKDALLKTLTMETGEEPTFEFKGEHRDYEVAVAYFLEQAEKRGNRCANFLACPNPTYKDDQGLYTFDGSNRQCTHNFTGEVVDLTDKVPVHLAGKVEIVNNHSETLATLQENQRKVKILLSSIFTVQFTHTKSHRVSLKRNTAPRVSLPTILNESNVAPSPPKRTR